jgi:hypothetical protein
MEVIGAIASVGGVIQLALHGIKCVDFLKAFIRNCGPEGEEAAAEFVHGLLAYVQLLHDVQALCGRTQKHRVPNVSLIRIATLQLHLEDCVRELEKWRGIATQLESIASRSNRGLSRHSSTRKGSQDKFLMLLSGIFGSAVLTKVGSVRVATEARFEVHKASIGVALSILEA